MTLRDRQHGCCQPPALQSQFSLEKASGENLLHVGAVAGEARVRSQP